MGAEPANPIGAFTTGRGGFFVYQVDLGTVNGSVLLFDDMTTNLPCGAIRFAGCGAVP
jgi:hypothetical protein